jgi:hypothetical protein
MSELSDSGASYTAPRLNTKNKDKKYHEDFARFIIHHSISEDWYNNHRLIAECYKFLEEGSNAELTTHMQKAEDGTDLPAMWLSLNTIPTKIDLLVGELEMRGYDIRVRALNKEAISRKLEEKERLRVKRRIKPLMDLVTEQTGLPDTESEYIPQSEEELNEYVDLSFKDKAEIIMEAALKWISKRADWDEERKAMFRDVLAAGRVFTINEIVRGVPRSQRLHPNSVIFDTSAKKDSLTDATYFGILEHIPLSAAAERYGLSEEEIKDVYSSYQEFIGSNSGKETMTTVSDYSSDFGTIAGNRLRWFKTVDGELRVLVARTFWSDYKILTHKNDKNEHYGTEHLQEIKGDPRKRDKDKLITNKLEVWRQCTIIGGRIIREAGECPNQARDLSDLATTEPPIKGWVPNFSSGRGVSKVEQLAQIQLMKDIAMYNMSLAMARAGAKGFSYDLAMVPENWTPEKVMRYLRTFGVSFYNSKESQLMPGGSSGISQFDMTMSDSITQYMNMMQFYESEMDKISGIAPERQGIVQGASQGLGVTQSALFQSNLITQPYYIGFERFCSRVLNHQAKQVKIAFANREIFAPIIGTTGIDFLADNIDLDLDEFGVVVESIPPIFTDRQKLEQLVSVVLQSDPSFLDDALVILMEPDTRVAVRKFQRKRAMRAIIAQEQARAQAEQQQAIQDRVSQLEMQKQQTDISGNLQEQQIKNQGALERSTAQGRVKLSSEKMRMIQELTKSRLPTAKK